MSTPVYSVTTPNGEQYNIERASAVSQKSLMQMVGARSLIINAQPKTPSDAMSKTETIVGMLMSFSESDFDKVASLALPKVIKSGGQEPVTIDHFQGSMMTYYFVVAEAIRENLSDFFTWLQVQNKNAGTQQKHQVSESQNLTP